jgi:hypothetical protein
MHTAFNAIAIFFSTLTAAIIVNPTWVTRVAWIVTIAAAVQITRLWMIWKYGNKRAAIFRAERDAERAARRLETVMSDHKVHVYRGAAFGEVEQNLIDKAGDRDVQATKGAGR